MNALRDYKASTNGKRTLEEAVAEVQREIEVRRRLYDKWVADCRMSRIDAHDRLERLLTALRYLLACSDDLSVENLPTERAAAASDPAF
jgi:hypothetical protein